MRTGKTDDAVLEMMRFEADAALAVVLVDQVLGGDGDGGEGPDGTVRRRRWFDGLRCLLLLLLLLLLGRSGTTLAGKWTASSSTRKESANVTSHLTNLGSKVVAELGPVHAVVVLIWGLVWILLLLIVMMMPIAAPTHVEGIAEEVHLVCLDLLGRVSSNAIDCNEQKSGDCWHARPKFPQLNQPGLDSTQTAKMDLGQGDLPALSLDCRSGTCTVLAACLLG